MLDNQSEASMILFGDSGCNNWCIDLLGWK